MIHIPQSFTNDVFSCRTQIIGHFWHVFFRSIRVISNVYIVSLFFYNISKSIGGFKFYATIIVWIIWTNNIINYIRM